MSEIKKEIEDRLNILIKKGLAEEQFVRYQSDILWYCNDKDIVYYGEETINQIKNRIEEYENQSGCKIYLVSIDWEPYTDNMVASCIFVSAYKGDWKYERESMIRNIAYSYVINLSREELSESGSILFEIANGDFRRIR